VAAAAEGQSTSVSEVVGNVESVSDQSTILRELLEAFEVNSAHEPTAEESSRTESGGEQPALEDSGERHPELPSSPESQ